MHTHLDESSVQAQLNAANPAWAATIYGNLATAFLAEAETGTCESRRLFAWAAANSKTPLVEALGLMPDLRSGYALTGLTRKEVADILLEDENSIVAMEYGLRQLSFGEAVLIARSIGWPLSFLFRDHARLHELTVLGRHLRGAM